LAVVCEALLVGCRRAVAFPEPLPCQLDLSPRHVHPGVTAGPRLVSRALALFQEPEVERRILVDGDRPVPAVARGDEAQLSLPLGSGKRFLLAGRLDARLLGDDRDLREVDRLVEGGCALA